MSGWEQNGWECLHFKKLHFIMNRKSRKTGSEKSVSGKVHGNIARTNVGDDIL